MVNRQLISKYLNFQTLVSRVLFILVMEIVIVIEGETFCFCLYRIVMRF